MFVFFVKFSSILLAFDIAAVALIYFPDYVLIEKIYSLTEYREVFYNWYFWMFYMSSSYTRMYGH